MKQESAELTQCMVREVNLKTRGLTYKFEPFEFRFAPLSKINLLVGPNNSGKSRLMRAVIHSLTDNEYVPWSKDVNGYWSALARCLELLEEAQSTNPHEAIPKMKGALLASPLRTLTEGRSEAFDKFANFIPQVSHLKDLKSQLEQLEPVLRKANHSAPKKHENLKIVYVPALRGFKSPPKEPRFFSKQAEDTYFKGIGTNQLAVECGGDTYIRLQSNLLGKKEQRKLVAEFERFLADQFFEGQSVTLVPNLATESIFVSLGREKEQPISSVGDGLQHLIAILFPLFVDKRPTFQVIEEPELFLHPGFQTRLLDCYMRPELDHVQLLTATHSNHLLNLTLDRSSLSVFRVKKEVLGKDEDQLPSFGVKYLSGDVKELLVDLGAERASLLLSNCVIFVEGPTDRRYFQRFIEQYARSIDHKTPLVDLHYSFLEYGGSNLSSYNFLDDTEKVDPLRLIGQDFIVIIDQDAGVKKQERREKLERSLGPKLKLFDAIEVENLLHPKVLRAVVEDYEGGPVSQFSSVKWEDYRYERLGSYIEKLLGDDVKRFSKSRNPYADVPRGSQGSLPPEGYTLKSKMAFCEKALVHIRSHEDMTEESLRLAKELFNFIMESNRNVKFSETKPIANPG